MDLISRQAAYEVLTVYYHHTTDVQHAALYDALSKVPSAERHGRWVDGEYTAGVLKMYGHKCSVCGAITPVSVARYRYCPNCGAKMDLGEENESR